MAKENSAGLGVNNRYGPRVLPEGKAGVVKTEGVLSEYVMHFSGQNVTDDDVEAPVIPAGFKPIRAIVEINQAFALGGTTPNIAIGTDGSETTNGFLIPEADAEATGVYIYEFPSASAGTWDAQLAANTTVGVALEGDTTITAAGKAKVTIVGYHA